MILPQQARLMQSKIPRSSENKKTSIGDIIQMKGIAQIKTIKTRHLYAGRNTTPVKHHCQLT